MNRKSLVVSTSILLVISVLLLSACQMAPPASPVAGDPTPAAKPSPVPTVDVAAIEQEAVDVAMAATEQQEAANMAVVQRFYDEFSAGKPEVILDVHTEMLTMHYAGDAEDVTTQVLYEDLAAIKAANPDLHAEIHSMIAAGDYVFTELTWAGTQTGDLFGIAATGKPIIHNGILLRRLDAGKIVESWEIWDDLTFLNSLGLVPSWDEIVAGEMAVQESDAEPTEAATELTGIRPGMYYARLQANNALGVDNGYYAVRLGDDGSYSIVWFGANREQMDAGESGLEGVSGTYVVDGNAITFTDVEGPAACTEADGVSGTYGYTTSESRVEFSVIDDSCQARTYVLTSEAMRRLNR